MFSTQKKTEATPVLNKESLIEFLDEGSRIAKEKLTKAIEEESREGFGVCVTTIATIEFIKNTINAGAFDA